MVKHPPVLITLIVGSLAACVPPEANDQAQSSPCALAAEDVSRIQSMEDEHERQVIGKDFDEMAVAWAEDVILLAPNQPQVVGKAQLREWQRAWEEITFQTYDQTEDEIVGCGDLAYARYHFAMTYTTPGATEPISDSGRGFHILRKQADGTWVITHDFFQSDKPLAPG